MLFLRGGSGNAAAQGGGEGEGAAPPPPPSPGRPGRAGRGTKKIQIRTRAPAATRSRRGVAGYYVVVQGVAAEEKRGPRGRAGRRPAPPPPPRPGEGGGGRALTRPRPGSAGRAHWASSIARNGVSGKASPKEPSSFCSPGRTRSRCSGAIRSWYSTPSKWSNSCCTMRACHPRRRIWTGFPFRSCPTTWIERWRCAVSVSVSVLGGGGGVGCQVPRGAGCASMRRLARRRAAALKIRPVAEHVLVAAGRRSLGPRLGLAYILLFLGITGRVIPRDEGDEGGAGGGMAGGGKGGEGRGARAPRPRRRSRGS